MTVGENIKNARNKKSYSRYKLSLLSNVSDETIKNWEIDKSSPTIDLLIRIADVLNISLDELVGRNV